MGQVGDDVPGAHRGQGHRVGRRRHQSRVAARPVPGQFQVDGPPRLGVPVAEAPLHRRPAAWFLCTRPRRLPRRVLWRVRPVGRPPRPARGAQREDVGHARIPQRALAGRALTVDAVGDDRAEGHAQVPGARPGPPRVAASCAKQGPSCPRLLSQQSTD